LLQSSTTTQPRADIACALNPMCLHTMATRHPEPPPQQQQMPRMLHRSCG
jgi:hypothetical protein